MFKLQQRKIDISEKKTKKPVNAEQGKRLASELGAVAYVECSAYTQEGMKNVFDEVTYLVLREQLLNLFSLL